MSLEMFFKSCRIGGGSEFIGNIAPCV